MLGDVLFVLLVPDEGAHLDSHLLPSDSRV